MEGGIAIAQSFAFRKPFALSNIIPRSASNTLFYTLSRGSTPRCIVFSNALGCN